MGRRSTSMPTSGPISGTRRETRRICCWAVQRCCPNKR
jgi:hypothetical protein